MLDVLCSSIILVTALAPAVDQAQDTGSKYDLRSLKYLWHDQLMLIRHELKLLQICMHSQIFLISAMYGNTEHVS